jgi:hypothetical protein
MLSSKDLHEPKNVLGSDKECFAIDNFKKIMYLEYKVREKRNRRREGVLSGGTILGRSTRMKKNIEFE